MSKEREGMSKERVIRTGRAGIRGERDVKGTVNNIGNHWNLLFCTLFIGILLFLLQLSHHIRIIYISFSTPIIL